MKSEDVNVLVVDDQTDIRRMLSRLLRKAGIEVTGEAATGEDAISWVRDNQVDVIVMDIQMPGIGGIGATAKIKASHPDITIFGFSACADARCTDIVSAGATAVFDKVDTQPLIGAVRGVRPSGQYAIARNDR